MSRVRITGVGNEFGAAVSLLKKVFLLVLILCTQPIFADIVFEKNVPTELAKSIKKLKNSRKLKNSFLIENQSNKYLLIISAQGLIRRLPLVHLEAEDVLNVMETMDQELERLKGLSSSNGTQKEPLKSELFISSPPRKKAEKEPQQRFSWLGWAEPDSRFYVGLTASTEAKFTGGVAFSVGVAFLRFSIRMQKGLNIDQGPGITKISWKNYLLGGQMNFVRFFGVTLSFGFEVGLYHMNEKWFEKEYIFLKAEYRYKWFVPGLSISVAPTSVSIQVDTKLYTMEQVIGMAWIQFAM